MQLSYGRIAPFYGTGTLEAMNRPVHFEIHADNPDRAGKFYSEVFGWTTKKYEFPGMDYWILMTGPDAKDAMHSQNPGLNGGIVKRMGPAPDKDAPVHGYICTMTVSNIDATIQKIVAAGGTEALAKNLLPGVGYLAYYKDTEGNIFGVMQEVSQPK
jgi:uncharacterized protein